MAIIVLRQAVMMFLLILLGAFCFKTKILTQESTRHLSALVLKIVNPIVILLAYQREFKLEFVANLGWTFVLAAVAYAVSFACAYLGIRDKEGRETVIERFSCIYSNCGFMGIPLVKAMFGDDGVFYLTAFLTCFNFLVWSHGVMQMSGQRSLRSLARILVSPAILAIAAGMVLFFCRITLPSLLHDTLSGAASVIGVRRRDIAESVNARYKRFGNGEVVVYNFVGGIAVVLISV